MIGMHNQGFSRVVRFIILLERNNQNGYPFFIFFLQNLENFGDRKTVNSLHILIWLRQIVNNALWDVFQANTLLHLITVIS